uniref:Uncharacterized protein n=1 Tax=Triticum urartu TaxID=4572 RepID=A0A8R7P5S2_TRIUA
MAPDRLFSPRRRYLRRCRLPRSVGMEPVRLALVMSRKERKERLPKRGVIGPWRDLYGSDSPVTLCRRRLHVTPTQWQKELSVVQFLARMPKGSENWTLKDNKAVRSASLPLPAVGLGEEHEMNESSRSSSSTAMEMHAEDTVAMLASCVGVLVC